MKKRSDFERVLMNIAVDTGRSIYDSLSTFNGYHICMRFGEPAPQFLLLGAAEAIGMPLKSGDIVKCLTNSEHHFGISVFVEKLDSYTWLLQEIGGEDRCNMSNEDLTVLRFMNPSRLYTGVKYKLYKWAYKAFTNKYNSDADYWTRCGGVEFDGDDLIIWSRTHIFEAEKTLDGKKLYAQPKKFVMKWSKKTRLKDIVAAMREQGFCDEFEYAENEPVEGLGGCVTFKADDLKRMIP